MLSFFTDTPLVQNIYHIHVEATFSVPGYNRQYDFGENLQGSARRSANALTCLSAIFEIVLNRFLNGRSRPDASLIWNNENGRIEKKHSHSSTLLIQFQDNDRNNASIGDSIGTILYLVASVMPRLLWSNLYAYSIY